MRISKGDVNSFPRFCAIPSKMMIVDSLCFFIGDQIDEICHMLNSEYATYYFFRNIAILDNGGMQMRQQYVENIPLPKLLKLNKMQLSDNEIFKAFNFNTEEISFIHNYIVERKQEILLGGDH